MAISETVTKNQCNIVLNTGTGADGQITTAKISLGTLSDSGWNPAKVLAVVSALGACLTNTVYGVNHIQTTSVAESQ